MSPSPAVSIIIPAYNAARFIEETVRAVTAQTFTDWELIIVDDGSPDNTAEVIKPLLSDNRIKYVYQPNGGVSSARNKGMEYISGKYVAFLDADDIWLKNNLEVKVSYLDTHPETDFVFSDVQSVIGKVDNPGKILVAKDNPVTGDILLWEGDVIPNPCSNVVFRTKCLDKGVKFDPNLSTAADQDFALQLTARFRPAKIPGVFGYYRVHNNSMSRNIELMERDHIAVFRKAEKNGLYPSWWFRQRCFSNLYLILAGSWWVNARNKSKGLYYMIRAILSYPPNSIRLLRKIVS